jgi:Polyketide cyclase / dehydrase and lipid transport
MPTSDAPLTARCLGCAYTLEGLPSPGPCPECGRLFDMADPQSYTRVVPFLRWKFWLPAWVLASACGLVGSIFAATLFQNWGTALWVGVPLSMGAIAGYAAKGGWLTLAVLVLGVMGSVLLGMASMNMGGVFCGIMLAGITLIPIWAGVFMGYILRSALKSSSFSQKRYLPVILLACIGPVWAAIEGPPAYRTRETVTTSRVIAAPVNAVWASIVFFEEVRHEPPLILRIGLAHPLYTLGKSEAVGDQKTCVYNKGRITKEVTEITTGQLLAFKVIEQDIGYERDVALVGGSFRLTPLDADHTTVTLTTSYVPRLGPRFAWRPGEKYAVHTLHDHVLEGMARKALAQSEQPDSAPTRPSTQEPADARERR